MALLIMGAGRVGAQMARIEVERGEKPIIFDVAPQVGALSDILDPQAVTLVPGDILNPLEIAATIRREAPTAIIHTVAYPLLTVGAQRNTYPAVVLNIVGTLNVLEAARLFGVERVVFCSSSQMYSSMSGGADRGAPGTEEAYPRPSTFYAATKQAGEDLGLNYARWYGLDFRTVRFCAVFGPWSGRDGGTTLFFRQLVQQSLQGEEVTIPDDGPRDIVYSKDAALGAVLAARVAGVKSRIFNIGMGRQYSGKEIAEAVSNAIPQARVRLVPPDEAVGDRTVLDRAPDIARAKNELGYEPQYLLQAALQDLVQFYSQKGRGR